MSRFWFFWRGEKDTEHVAQKKNWFSFLSFEEGPKKKGEEGFWKKEKINEEQEESVGKKKLPNCEIAVCRPRFFAERRSEFPVYFSFGVLGFFFSNRGAVGVVVVLAAVLPTSVAAQRTGGNGWEIKKNGGA